MKRVTQSLTLLALLLMLASAIDAFVPLWNRDQHLPVGDDLAVNDRDFPEGRRFHEEIQDATNFLNRIAGTNYDLDHATYNQNGLAITIYGNGRNEVHRGNLPDTTAGRATQTAIGSHTDECDININDDPKDFDGSDLNWSARAPSPANRLPLQLVFIHEMGHCTGLDHNDNRANTMATSFAIGDEGPWIGENFDAEPSEDERDWLRHVHPDSTSGANVAMTTWACCASNGAPSNSLFTESNLASGQKRVRFTFGYLNVGTTSESGVRVDYRIVPVSDPRWAAGTFVDSTTIGTINSNVPFEFEKVIDFTHPGDECYHIGAFIDSNNAVSENNESNNKVISRWSICA